MTLAHLRERDIATRSIASELRQGQLALVLGAGVSKGLGLPNWGELVVSVETRSGVGVGSLDAPSEDLMRRMDVARRACDSAGESFPTVVREALYEPAGYLTEGNYPDSLLESRMLIALGALVMSSVRGSVSDVFTLNFDDVLDWYLHLHGFKTQVVHQMPVLLSGSVDVRIHHFHGFLPLRPEHTASDWLVLTHSELRSRLAEPTSSPWSALMGSEFLSKTLLFVGSSMSDMDVDVILDRSWKLVDGTRPLGFALGAGISADRAASLEELGIVPISVGAYSEIPTFLLDVCQMAAKEPPRSVRRTY